MNAQKICFILCVNDKYYEQECLYYINRLFVPDGYETDTITIWDAPCMTSGYNAGMEATDAKYKIYLHQDVFLINRHFLFDILSIFQDSSVGMLGMVGAKQLPPDGIMWHAPRIGCIFDCHVSETTLSTFDFPPEQCEVAAIDGLLMATQYDLPWRDDIFKHWDFYDISQSIEFQQHGYKIVVPKIEFPWCIHDNGFLNLDNYMNEQKIYMDYYAGFHC